MNKVTEEFQARVQQVAMPGETYFYVIADLDHLQKQNLEGPAKGDEVIALFEKTLKSFAHKDEFLARTGGGEFSLILTDGAESRLNHLREEFAKISPCTFSAGVAPLAGDITEAWRQAQEALFKAKMEGRNKVVVV